MKGNASPRVSVLIPVWNAEKYIERCLRSVFGQTAADRAEFILVDDCSPDNSMKVAETVIGDYPHLKNQIRIIRHETNRGLAAARISAFSQAQGKYIINVDSDDWVEPDYLEELLNTAERENADVAGCNLIKEFANRSEPVKTPLPPDGKECVGRLLTGEIPGWLPVKLMKKEVIDSNSGTRWWVEGLDMTEDLLFSVQFFYYARKIVYVDKDLYHYELGNNTSIAVQNYLTTKKCSQLIGVMANIEKFLGDSTGLFQQKLLERKSLIKTVILMKTKKSDRKEYYRLYNGELKILKPENVKIFIIKRILRLYDFHAYFLGDFLINILRKIRYN